MIKIIKNFFICIFIFSLGIYLILPTISIKPSFTGTFGWGQKSGNYHITRDGGLITNNKYKIVSAIITVEVYDQNNELIEKFDYEYKEGDYISYHFIVNNPDEKVERFRTKIHDIKLNNNMDITVAALCFTVSIITLINKLAYIKKIKTVQKTVVV